MDSQPLPKLYARSLRPVLICQLCRYLWNAVAPYSTFRLRSLCVNGCLPRSSCVNGCLPNTLLTCQDVPGSHSAFLCRVKGHTLTSCARRRGSLGTRQNQTRHKCVCVSKQSCVYTRSHNAIEHHANYKWPGSQ